MFSSLIAIVQNAGKKIYLLVDEYDGPANKQIANLKNFQFMYSNKHGGIREFFEVVKNFRGVIARAFVTGVSPLLLSEILTLDSWTDITLEPPYARILGITQEDLDQIIPTVTSKTWKGQQLDLVLKVFGGSWNV